MTNVKLSERAARILERRDLAADLASTIISQKTKLVKGETVPVNGSGMTIKMDKLKVEAGLDDKLSKKG